MRSCRPIPFLLLSASFCCGPAANTQILVHPTQAQWQMGQAQQRGGLEEAKLLTSTDGWACSDKQLMFTTDQGATWKDITPAAGGAGLTIAAVRFTSPTQGWVLREKEGKDEGSWTLILSSTTDQGTTWQDLPVTGIPELAGASDSAPRSYSGRAEIEFETPRHGWLALRGVSSTAFSYGNLYETEDGGRSWREMPKTPIFGIPLWEASETAYLIGGAGGFEAYKTMDGGQTWNDLKIPESPGHEKDAQSFSDARVRGQQITLLRTIGTREGPETAEVIQSTDGGANWTTSSKSPPLPSDSSSVAILAGEDTTVQAFRAPGNGRIVFGEAEHLRAAALPSTWAQSEVTLLALSFPDAQAGWMQVSKWECGKDGCTQGTYLLRTSDGGRTFQDAPVPFRTTLESLGPPRPAPKPRNRTLSQSSRESPSNRKGHPEERSDEGPAFRTHPKDSCA